MVPREREKERRKKGERSRSMGERPPWMLLALEMLISARKDRFGLHPSTCDSFFFHPERIVVIIDAISCNASFLNLNNSPINL